MDKYKEMQKCKIILDRMGMYWIVVVKDEDYGGYDGVLTPDFLTYKEAKEWVKKSKYFKLGRI